MTGLAKLTQYLIIMTTANKALCTFVIILIIASGFLLMRHIKLLNENKKLMHDIEKGIDRITEEVKRNDSIMFVLDSLENELDSLIISLDKGYEEKIDSLDSLDDDDAVVWFESYIKSYKPRLGQSGN